MLLSIGILFVDVKEEEWEVVCRHVLVGVVSENFLQTMTLRCRMSVCFQCESNQIYKLPATSHRWNAVTLKRPADVPKSSLQVWQ